MTTVETQIPDSVYKQVKSRMRSQGKKETTMAVANVEEAEVIKPAEEGEEVFERMPTPPKPMALFESDVQRFNPAPAVQDIWGKWPGDESIEELLSALTP